MSVSSHQNHFLRRNNREKSRERRKRVPIMWGVRMPKRMPGMMFWGGEGEYASSVVDGAVMLLEGWSKGKVRLNLVWPGSVRPICAAMMAAVVSV